MLIVLSDFDGTIVSEDLSIEILNHFVTEDWERYDSMLDRGEITLEECMKSQFELIRSTKVEIIDFIIPKANLRDGFLEFVSYLRSKNIELVVVSASMKFVVKAILNYHGCDLEIVAADVTENNGLKLDPVKYGSLDFKADIIREYQQKGLKVIFVGDGLSDRGGALASDYVFSVSGRSLEKYLQNKRRFESFSHFSEIIQFIKSLKL